ncbi:hypothetical protein LIER_11302 [Lithospermum erythrorhizon]|uniref:Uncharacterized protein n=1 Tax=Lithospermum erythrorhizon TaxID=34254 RepID=A0AAV3PMG9_LITER
MWALIKAVFINLGCSASSKEVHLLGATSPMPPFMKYHLECHLDSAIFSILGLAKMLQPQAEGKDGEVIQKLKSLQGIKGRVKLPDSVGVVIWRREIEEVAETSTKEMKGCSDEDEKIEDETFELQ